MKQLIYALGFALFIAACAPGSRDKSNDNTNWLMQDGRSAICIQQLRYRGAIPPTLPVSLYSDWVNIIQIRQQNPGVYALTETEFKGLCRTVGIDFNLQPVDPDYRRDN